MKTDKPQKISALAKLWNLSPKARRRMLDRMTPDERLAVTVPCDGEAHKNPHIDGCTVCLHTGWGRVLRPLHEGPALTVTISGPCAAGKTTLALAFQAFLEERGFTGVSVTDADVAYRSHAPELQPRRMESIARDRRVFICTVQENKG